MAIYNAIYSKSGTATTTPTALSTVNPEKYDSIQLFNDDAAIAVTFAINGASVKVLAGETISIEVRACPNNITVASASATAAYRVIAVGR